MKRSLVRPICVLVVLLSLLISPAASPAMAHPAAPLLAAAVPTGPQAGIIVDGVIDAAYGPPIASDSSGDGNGNPNMDLLDLYVAQDATNFYFAYTINADIGATNWGKYVMYVDTTNDAAGATSDAWTRNVVVNDPHKPEYGIYTWVDAAPYDPGDTQIVPWTGSAWDWGNVRQVAAGAIGAGTPSVIEWQVAKADLGSPNTLWVEIWNTGGGGGDNAQDTINNPADDWNATDWSTQAVLANSTQFGAPLVDGQIDQVYGAPIASDSAGDGNGNPNMDLLDLYVAEDINYLYFAYTINADIGATNWGKYVMYVDTTNDASGATSDAWTRNVVVNDPHKPEYGIYTWVDAAPYDPGDTQIVPWTGSAWDWGNVHQVAAGAIGAGTPSAIEWQVAKADLGNPASVWMEVWDTGGGGGDNAQDTINDPADDWNASDWSTQAVLANSTFYQLKNYEPTPPGTDDNVWWDGLEHDSRSDMYRTPFGAVPKMTPVTLRFRTYAGDVTEVKARVWDNTLGTQSFYPMTQVATLPGDPFDYAVWQVELDAPDYETILYYRFLVTDGSDTDYYEDDDLFDGGLGQAYNDSPDYSYQIDVYDPAFDTPDWFKNAVVYQIFPDRFRNGVSANDPISGTFFYNEDPGVLTAPQWNWIVPDPRETGPWEGSYSKLFYGGDLQGIIDRLDYIENLGVTTLYLNPIFESPSNHKYDTTDYEAVDDNFGDLATFQTLVAELEARDMHLVLDGVFNHTSSDSVYFDRYGHYAEVGACEDVNSPYRTWYYFTPASPAGTGVCAGDTNYQAWWGFDSLPKLNTTDDGVGVRDYLYRVTPAIGAYWLEQGADGWRLDVAGDVNSTFWQDWRPYIRTANPDAITIAEEWGDASRFILGDQLDSAMNYRFRNALIGLLRETDWQDTNSFIAALTVSQFDSLMHSIEEDYPAEAWYAALNLVDSHDTNRVLIPLDQDGDPTDADYSDGKARQKVLAIVQMTMPGAPTIYYGDEVGLTGFGQASSANPGGVYYSDPYNRQPYPWPDLPGYSDLPAWRKQDTGMRIHYATLAAIRNAHPALRTGSFDTLLADDGAQVYAYGRKLGDDAAVVVVNRSTSARGINQSVAVDVSGYLPEGTILTDELNGGSYTVTGGQVTLTVAPLWGAVLTANAGQDLIPPNAPANLAAVEGDSVVSLSWDAVASAAAYNLYRSYVTGGGYTLIASGLTGTTYDDTTAVNGTWYYYVVTALDAAGNESVRSNEAAAMPHATIGWAGNLEPPAIVHTIGIVPTQPISAQVWIDGLTNPAGQGQGVLAEVGYGISGTLPSAWDTWIAAEYVGDIGSNDQYAAGLVPEEIGTFQYVARFSTTQGRDWSYALTAANQPGVLTVLPSADTTAPDTPLNLRVTDWSAGWIALAWDPVTGDPTLYAYDLYRSEVSGTVGTKIARVLAPTTTYTDASVTGGQTYYYVVQAVDTSFNLSGYSNQVEATAQAKMVAVTFQVVVPDYTPADATIYVAGDAAELCGWCDPQTVALTKTGDVTWTRVITLADGLPIQYKYTRGSWDVNEWWGPIVGLENRHATISYGVDGHQLLADTVHYWRDPLVIAHEPASGEFGVDPAATISVTLSRYLDPDTITFDNVAVSGGAAAPVLEIGFFHHTEMTATTILLTPTVSLDEGTMYMVTLKTGLKGLGADNEGIALQQEYAWRFFTAGGYWYYLPVVTKQ